MRKLLVVALAATLLTLAFATVAKADPPDVIPNGAWVIPGQTVSVDRILTNEEVGAKLHQIEARSNGRLVVEQAGTSAGGYPLWVAKFGEYDAAKHRIFVEANIHGNELSGNMAIINMVQYLAMSGNKEVKDILDNCVIWFLPMMNPDGAMYENIDGERVPRRQNVQIWDPTQYGLPAGTQRPSYYTTPTPTRLPGFDINRDFWYDFSVVQPDGSLDPTWLSDPTRVLYRQGQFGFFLTPEARAWAALFNELQPEFLFACHHEGTDVAGDTGDLVQVALLGQAILESGASDGLGNTIYPAQSTNSPASSGFTGSAFDLGQKVVLNIYEKVGGHFAGAFARYCADSAAQSPSCSQGVAEVNGCGIILNEVRNQGTQKAMGMQINILENNMWETFKAFADNSIYDVEIGEKNSYGAGANYEAIPVQRSVRNPHPAEEEENDWWE